MASSSPVKLSVGRYGPSSTTTTDSPASASSAAAHRTAGPGADHHDVALQASATEAPPVMDAPGHGSRRGGGWGATRSASWAAIVSAHLTRRSAITTVVHRSGS